MDGEPSSAGSAVRVAVRVRPLARRELTQQRAAEEGSGSLLQLQPPATLVYTSPASAATAANPASAIASTIPASTGAASSKTFTFDHVYFSNSQTAAEEDQEAIFNDLGRPLVEDALRGYNVAIFAYGQTGSGKTYSMMGSSDHPGLVPRLCATLFDNIAAQSQSSHSSNNHAPREYQVTVSMMEIYNERVRDLLARHHGAAVATWAARDAGHSTAGSFAPPPNNLAGLKVRQSPTTGFFVEGLSHVAVSSAQEILDRLTAGAMARTTASTGMNETSSRSHMLVTLRVKQIFLNDNGQSTTMSSEINLVDLAGSERASTSGSDRLREGAAINQSLSALGNVISALAEKTSRPEAAAVGIASSATMKGSLKKSSGARPGDLSATTLSSGKAVNLHSGSGGKSNTDTNGERIPYRNSVLTKLLRNALGGNSKTVMLATVSPSQMCADETLSTLRYADRAKRIRNHAIVNESSTDKLIRSLREENERLLKQLKRGDGNPDMLEHLQASEAELQRRMVEMETTWSNRLAAARAEWESELAGSEGLAAVAGGGAARLATEPFFSNINPDPMLSHLLKHVLPDGTTIVGRDERNWQNRLAGGIGALAAGTGDSDKTPRPSMAFAPGHAGNSRMLLNGPSIQMQHAIVQREGDTVTLTAGSEAVILVNGRQLSGSRVLQHFDRVVFSPTHVFLFRAASAQRGQGGAKATNIDTLDYDFVQMEIASAQGMDEILGPVDDGIASRNGSVHGRDKVGSQGTNGGFAAASTHGILGSAGQERSQLTAEQRQLRQDLLHLAPMITQANAISAELGRGARLELLVRSGAAHALNDKTKAIMIQVTNTKTGYVWHWTKAKFINRCRFIQELYDQYEEGLQLPDLDQDPERDPFWDPPEDLFLGSAYLYLQPLAHGLSVEEMSLPVSNYRGVTVGTLQVCVELCDAQGQPHKADFDEDIEQPSDWIDRRLDLLVHIHGASHIEWLEADSTRGVFVQYRFYTDSKMRQTRTVHHSQTPQLGYSKQFTIRSVSSNFLNYLTTNALVLELWGKQGTGLGPAADGGDGLPRSISRREGAHTSAIGRESGVGGSSSSGGGNSSSSNSNSNPSSASSSWRSTMSTSLMAAQGEKVSEQTLDALLKESAWIDERRRLLERISSLEQEVGFLSIEKGALEKEMSSISLRSPSASREEQSSHAALEAMQRFLRNEAAIRTRYELAVQCSTSDADEVKALGSLCEHQVQESEMIAGMLRSMCKDLQEAVTLLADRSMQQAEAAVESPRAKPAKTSSKASPMTMRKKAGAK